MRSFHIRDFFSTPRAEWPCGDLEKFVLTFDEGESVVATTPRLEVSHKLWRALRDWPDAVLTKKHYLADGAVPWRSIEDVLSESYKSILEAYGEWETDREAVWRSLRYAADDLYNEAYLEYAPWARSMDDFHLQELYDHPKITAIRQALAPTASRPFPSSAKIDRANSEFVKLMKTDDSLLHNPIVLNFRAGLVKVDQTFQILVIRGFNTQIDSTIQPTPIMGDYYAGINDPAEMLMDSSLASKAILFQGDPLKQTEYANRILQFSSSQIDLITTGDCGTTALAPILITKERAPGLDGIYYKDPKSGKLIAFNYKEDKDLIGETREFRLAIFCGYRHLNSVCSTCYGKLALNIPYGTNIGTLASMRTMSAISQLVLKVKHVEGSVSSEPLIMTNAELEYITPGASGQEIYLNPGIDTTKTTLLIKTSPTLKIINGQRLPVLTKQELLESPDLSKHSQFREFIFKVEREDGKSEILKTSVSRGVRISYLTEEFLEWFLDKDFYVHPDGNYHIDLTDWDMTKPILQMPNKHTSMKDFAAVYEVFVRSSRDESASNLGKLKQLRNYVNMTDAIADMYDMIEEKLSVHFSHVAVVAMSMLAPATAMGRAIPPIDEPASFVKYSRIINEGSLGPLYAYQGGSNELTNISQYLNRERPQHLLDYLLLPL